MNRADHKYRVAGELWQLAEHSWAWGADEGLPQQDVDRFGAIVAGGELPRRIELAKLDALRCGLELSDHILMPWPIRSLCRGAAIDEADRDRLRGLADTLYVVMLRCRAAEDCSSSSNKKDRMPPERSSEQVNADRRIVQAWDTGEYSAYSDLADAMSLQERDVRLALDRHRKRELRRAVKT